MACAASGRSRFPARLRGVLGGACMIVALTHAGGTEYDEDDGSHRRVRDRCGRRWPICSCRNLRGCGPTQTAGPEWEGLSL